MSTSLYCTANGVLLHSSLSKSQLSVLCMQWEEASAKLATLKSTAKLVTAAERSAVEKAYAEALDHWAKRRRMFRSIWCVCLKTSRISVEAYMRPAEFAE